MNRADLRPVRKRTRVPAWVFIEAQIRATPLGAWKRVDAIDQVPYLWRLVRVYGVPRPTVFGRSNALLHAIGGRATDDPAFWFRIL